ncbi:TetR/AcrR family transcriptional regulator [Actinosynnema sp. NPDC059335]|uniref:TetR/AcrR family transcriptional regulator n=1 Tax=Actinosynnema sp. NPDC059335 TaxID=3346804 RepID=UPI00366E14CB
MTGRGRQRADATRNRAAILDAARTLIAAHGPDVGMDRIATAAGVAVGTLYRHFPTKQDLVGAIVADLAATIAGALDSASGRVRAGQSTAVAEIVGLLHRVVVTLGQERVLRDAVAEVDGGVLRPVQERAVRSLADLVAAAHADHALREDVTVDDISLLLATSPGVEVPEDVRLRWVELARRSLTR